VSTTSTHATLIRAAYARDWATARAATQALVAAMPAEDAVALARAEVAQRLPLFEAHHPDATWARAYLEGAPGAAVVTDDEWSGPGGNNFAGRRGDRGARRRGVAGCGGALRAVTYRSDVDRVHTSE
jgi:hypothetical protein